MDTRVLCSGIPGLIILESKRVALVSRPETYQLLDTQNGTCLRSLPRCDCGLVQIRLDGSFLIAHVNQDNCIIIDEKPIYRRSVKVCFIHATMDAERLMIGYVDRIVVVVDIQTQTKVFELSTESDIDKIFSTLTLICVRTISSFDFFDANTGELIRRTERFKYCSMIHNNIFYVVGSSVMKLNIQSGATTLMNGHTADITSLYSDVGRIYTIAGDNTVRIWDPDTGTEITRIDDVPKTVTVCGDYLFLLSDTWKAYEIQSGKLLYIIPSCELYLSKGAYGAVKIGEYLLVFEIATGKRIGRIEYKYGFVFMSSTNQMQIFDEWIEFWPSGDTAEAVWGPGSYWPTQL